MIKLRCHFDGKSLIPDEQVVLPEGTALVAHIEEASPAAKQSDSSIDWLFANGVDDPALPEDLSVQHDHYLYGQPKK